jgi:hypothetical protein
LLTICVYINQDGGVGLKKVINTHRNELVDKETHTHYNSSDAESDEDWERRRTPVGTEQIVMLRIRRISLPVNLISCAMGLPDEKITSVIYSRGVVLADTTRQHIVSR